VSDLWFDVSGTGPPVVLLHEGFVDSRVWEPQLEPLAERFTVIRYDQRGYGRSPRFDGAYSPVDDLCAVLDAARFERAALVGGSRGARIALDAALVYPERVTALVLVCPGLGGHSIDVGTTEQEERWNAAEEARDLEAMAEIDLELWAPLGDEGGLRRMALDNAHLNLVDDPAEHIEPPAKGRLGEVSAPTLVITGDGDQPAMDEIADLLVRGIPNARREVLPGDHFPNIRSPERFSELVLEFLGTHLRATV
jgi:pimeloyl-ACP methyl ester carboxylesterase